MFDLRFLPNSGRTARTQFPDAYETGELPPPHEGWLDDAVSDIQQSDSTGLRSFLRRVGGDIDSGRDVFAALCRLHLLLNESTTNPAAIDYAISLLQMDLFTDQAKSVRGIVATAALKDPHAITDSSFPGQPVWWGIPATHAGPISNTSLIIGPAAIPRFLRTSLRSMLIIL